jgi:hypothetical protein
MSTDEAYRSAAASAWIRDPGRPVNLLLLAAVLCVICAGVAWSGERLLRPHPRGDRPRRQTLVTTQEQRLRDGALRQLEWDPQFDASRVGVTVKDGIVTLSGYVATYSAKLAAERCVRKVYGIQGIANELQVSLAEERIDPDLAHDAVTAMKNHVEVPAGIEVTVRNGTISLSGARRSTMSRKTTVRATPADSQDITR